MVLTIKVPLKEAERVKRALQEKGLFAEAFRYGKDEAHVYFPVKEEFESRHPFEERELKQTPKKAGLKEALEGALSAEEQARLKRSMDLVGSIAIIEVEPELEAKEELIAQAILRQNKNVKSVVKKLGGHEGELRLQKYQLLAGEDVRESVVKENGVRLKIDIEGVYYSVRTATERKRVASQVKPGERVLVMFSGAGPYVCVIAKKSRAEEVVGIELNERGHELAVENARLNKLTNAVLIQGDVRDVVPELARRGVLFDRIVMPLPHTGADFLDEALMLSRSGTVIHLYDFEQEGEFEKAAEKARAGAARNKKSVKILKVVPCGQHSPRMFRVCVDFVVK